MKKKPVKRNRWKQAFINVKAVNSLVAVGRGLHSSHFRLNVSAFSGIGGAFRGCWGSLWEVAGGIGGY